MTCTDTATAAVVVVVVEVVVAVAVERDEVSPTMTKALPSAVALAAVGAGPRAIAAEVAALGLSAAVGGEALG